MNLAQIRSAVGSRDISYTNKSHRQRPKQNLTQFTACGKNESYSGGVLETYCIRLFPSQLLYGNWTTRGYANWRTGQLAVSQTPPKERKLSTQSRPWHPRDVQSASWRIRELSSNLLYYLLCRLLMLVCATPRPLGPNRQPTYPIIEPPI